MAILAILLTSGTALVLQQQGDQRITQSLSREANELLLLSETLDFESSQQLLERFIQRSSPDFDEQIFAVVDNRVVLRSGGSDLRLDQSQEFLDIATSASTTTLDGFDLDGEQFRWISVPVSSDVDNGHLISVFSLKSQQDQTNAALASFVFLALLGLVLTSLVGWFGSGRIFRPIKEISTAAADIGHANLSGRVPVMGNNNELDQLANEFNSMLDRVEQSFQNQKQFVDDAGHELRTPLTVIRGHLDLLATDPKANAPSLQIVRDELERMSRLVGDLQTLTKSNQPGFTKKEVIELQVLSDELFVKAEALAERNWIQAPLDGDTSFELDRQRITQAVLQLADNACSHTKPGDDIEIGISSTKTNIQIFVADSGPGIPEKDRDRVVKRFARAAHHSEHGEGSGLGLAVADAIAKGHGGRLEIGDSTLGGARVAIVLPRGEK